MNANLFWWHDAESVCYRPSQRILICLFLCGWHTAESNSKEKTHVSSTCSSSYKEKERLIKSHFYSVNNEVCVCPRAPSCTRVLVCVTGTGKQSKPIWLMHIGYQMEHNPQKYKGLNTLQYSLPLLDPANFWDKGEKNPAPYVPRNSLVTLCALLHRLMLAHLRTCQSGKRKICSL